MSRILYRQLCHATRYINWLPQPINVVRISTIVTSPACITGAHHSYSATGTATRVVPLRSNAPSMIRLGSVPSNSEVGLAVSFWKGMRMCCAAAGVVAGAYTYTLGASVACEGNQNDNAKDQNRNSEPNLVAPSRAVNPYIKSIVDNPKMQEKLDRFASQIGNWLTSLVETGVPSQITAGFTAGFAMGYAIKKSLKAFAIVFGILLVFMQCLAFAGYVKTEWTQLSETFINILDQNGDGIVDDKDMRIWWEKAAAVVGYNLPAGSGVIAGFTLGIRTG